jgi:hypothetical protein
MKVRKIEMPRSYTDIAGLVRNIDTNKYKLIKRYDMKA